jgi:hypothetical protein
VKGRGASFDNDENDKFFSDVLNDEVDYNEEQNILSHQDNPF